MNKNYLLSLVAVLICNVLSFGKSQIGEPKKSQTPVCYETPSLIVQHPNCNSPHTGTITIDTPPNNFLYTIDGVNYQESPVFESVLPGTYHVSYMDSSGCHSAVDVVPVNAAMPHATISVALEDTMNQSVCKNSDIAPINFVLGGTATQAVVSGMPAGITTSFSDGVFTISGSTSASGLYNFSIVTNGSCPATLSGTILVKLNAALAWVPSSGARNQTLCAGNPIIPIKYMVANGATDAQANVFPAGISGSISGGIYTISGTPADSGIHNFTISSIGGCSVANSNITLVVNPLADLQLQCGNQSETQQSLNFNWQSIPDATSYNYSYSINAGSPVSGVVSGTPEFTVPGVLSGQSVVFTISAVNGVPCFNSQSVTCVQEQLGDEIFNKETFNFYPNPVKDVLHIDSQVQIKTVTVFNMLGQKVFETVSNETNSEINMAAYRAGIYVVRINSDDESKTFNIIKD